MEVAGFVLREPLDSPLIRYEGGDVVYFILLILSFRARIFIARGLYDGGSKVTYWMQPAVSSSSGVIALKYPNLANYDRVYSSWAPLSIFYKLLEPMPNCTI